MALVPANTIILAYGSKWLPSIFGPVAEYLPRLSASEMRRLVTPIHLSPLVHKAVLFSICIGFGLYQGQLVFSRIIVE